MTSWLRSHLKSDIQGLANEAGLSYPESANKNELVEQLDEHLRANSSTLAGKPAFNEYYSRVRDYTGSPVKRERKATAPPAGDSEEKPARRRRTTTKVKDEFQDSPSMDDTPTGALVKTPGRAMQRTAARIPLPPSPAVITDAIERQTKAVRRRASGYWKKSGITEVSENTREQISNVVSINVFFAALESYALQRVTVPWRYAFSTPAIKALGVSSQDVSLPDLFVFLTSAFWSPTLLWTSTSVFIPLIAAYFFNITLQSRREVTKYSADPLTYNIAKALLTWLVYACGWRFSGFVSDETVDVLKASLPYPAPLVGAGVGMLVSVYEAILRK